MYVILENIKAAKDFLVKKEIKRNRDYESINDVPKEYSDRILNHNSKFQSILKLTQRRNNYTYPFTLFAFGGTDENVSLSELTDLMKWIEDNNNIISSLPLQIQQYAKIKKTQGVIGGFEKLNDDIRTLERKRNTLWVSKKINSQIRQSFKNADDETKEEYYNLVNQWMIKYPKTSNLLVKNELRDEFFKKVSKFSSFDEFMENFRPFISLMFTKRSELQTEILKYANKNIGAFSLEPVDEVLPIFIFNEEAQKGLCSLGNWCINTGAFYSYGGTVNRIQLNIYDFNEPQGNKYHLIGITFEISDKDITIYTAADINDSPISKGGGQSIRDFFKYVEEKFGKSYPQALINDIEETLPHIKEVNVFVDMFKKDKQIKEFLDSIRKGEDKKGLISSILTEGPEEIFNNFGVKMEDKKNIKHLYDLLSGFIDIKMKDKLPTFVNFFKEMGVVAYTDYQIYNKRIEHNISSQDNKEIIKKTKESFVTIEDSVNYMKEQGDKHFNTKLATLNGILANKDKIIGKLSMMEAQKTKYVKNYKEFLFEYETLAAEPERPAKEPIVIPHAPPKTRPGKRPGPIPGKRPFTTPEPSKASTEDVLDRLNNIIRANG